jgi:ribonuclease HI
MGTWTLYFDGLTEPRNPGGRMCWGYSIQAEGMPTIDGAGTISPKQSNTNNQAEYLALGYALKKVTELIASGLKCDVLLIHGDSKLVIEQVSGRWAVKAPGLVAFHARCVELVRSIGNCRLMWIPREKNEHADQLSRQAYIQAEGHEPPTRTKFR